MKLRQKRLNQKGVAAIEFAIVLPLLLLLLFGIIEFSILLYDKAMITNASREGARAGVVFRPDHVTLTEAEIENVVKKFAEANIINFGPTDLKVKATHTDSDGTQRPVTEDPGALTDCPDSLGNPASCIDAGELLEVHVDYQHDFLVLPSFVSKPITAISLMRYE